MTNHRFQLKLVALLAAASLAACGRKAEDPEPQSAQGTAGAHDDHSHGAQGDHSHDAKDDGGRDAALPSDHAALGSPVAPASTIPAILRQIDEQEKAIASAIEAGELGDIHTLAFNVRDLVAALSERASGLPTDETARLKEAAETIHGIAEWLDASGDRGDLDGTQKNFSDLKTQLEIVRGLKGLPAASLEAASHPPRAETIAMTGEIIDPQCYFMHDGRGESHIACATLCAEGGQGLAFLEDGTSRVYPLIAKAHGKSQNDGLIPHIGRPVRIQGVAYRKGEIVFLQIQSIEAAAKKRS